MLSELKKYMLLNVILGFSHLKYFPYTENI